MVIDNSLLKVKCLFNVFQERLFYVQIIAPLFKYSKNLSFQVFAAKELVLQLSGLAEEIDLQMEGYVDCVLAD